LKTPYHNASPIPDRRKLSVQLTELLDEAKQLSRIETELGRAPEGSWKTSAKKRIREWFNAQSNETSPTKAIKQSAEVTIRYNTLQEIFFWHGGNPEDQMVQCILEGIDPLVAQRLLQDGDTPSDSVPNDDDIPF
jgi:hypothetical protein